MIRRIDSGTNKSEGKGREVIPEPATHDFVADERELGQLSREERSVFAEVARALKTIQFGSLVLTVHEGRLVELTKTVRLRTNSVRCAK